MLLWRFDPLALQSHLTNRKVDEFLTSIMREFPESTQLLLKVCRASQNSADLQTLSCMPSIGVPNALLARALDMSVDEVELALESPMTTGCTTGGRSGQDHTVRFSHDRYRVRQFMSFWTYL
jgi:hypothetical protein